MKLHVTLPLALAAFLATISGAAFATDRDGDREAAAMQGAKISLTQAIATAEQHTGGKAYDAGVDAKRGQTHIVVETNGPNGIQTVSIDGQSGQITDSHAGGEED